MEDNVNVGKMSLVGNVPDVRKDTMDSQDVKVCPYSHSIHIRRQEEGGQGEFDGIVKILLDNQELIKSRFWLNYDYLNRDFA